MAGIFNSAIFNNSVFNTGVTSTPGREGLGGDDVPRPYRKSPHRGWNRDEWKARVKDGEDAIERTLKEAYAALTSDEAPISVLARVDAIVRPVAKKKVRPEAPQLRINWEALANDRRRANAMIRLWREEQELRAIEDDDEDILMMAACL